MNIRTQLFVVAVTLWCMLQLVNMVRRHKVALKYTLLWFVLGGCVLVLACFPGITARIASLLGIALPINLLFFAGFCFSLIIVFSLTTSFSLLAEKNKVLTQELALLKHQIEHEKDNQV